MQTTRFTEMCLIYFQKSKPLDRNSQNSSDQFAQELHIAALIAGLDSSEPFNWANRSDSSLPDSALKSKLQQPACRVLIR
jgi:hypothetical protein